MKPEEHKNQTGKSSQIESKISKMSSSSSESSVVAMALLPIFAFTAMLSFAIGLPTGVSVILLIGASLAAIMTAASFTGGTSYLKSTGSKDDEKAGVVEQVSQEKVSKIEVDSDREESRNKVADKVLKERIETDQINRGR